MNTSRFMDKQIMDLSSSQSNNDFIDLMNPQEDHIIGGGGGGGGGGANKEDILPSYDFHPIRSVAVPSQPSSIESVKVDGTRAWNSADHTAAIRSFGSVDSTGAKLTVEKDPKVIDASLVLEIDLTMKKHADNLLQALEGVSARLSQLETRTRNVENSVDDLKESIGKNYGSADGKMRQLENILREVQAGVQIIKDKQETMEVSKGRGQQTEMQNHVPVQQPTASAPQQSHQQFPVVAPPQPPPTLPLPDAPPPPHHNLPPPPPQQHFPPPPTPQQNLAPPPMQLQNHQIPPVPQRDSYFPPPGPTPDVPNQQYQLPPQQQLQPPPPPLPQNQYQPPPLPQYSQPPGPPPQHPSLSPYGPAQPQPPLAHHPEETPHIPPSHKYPPPPRHPPSHPPSEPSYQPEPHLYEPPPGSRPSSGFSGSYGLSSGLGEYSYSGSPPQYGGGGSPMKSHQFSSSMGRTGGGGGGGSGYPQLPTARILPQALPTASEVASGSAGGGGGGGGNKVPIDDVVEKVTNMGFPRDHVRATVRKLTENGQAVDLNVVLDKLMNGGGEGQPPRGWFGQ